jgi:trypsin
MPVRRLTLLVTILAALVAAAPAQAIVSGYQVTTGTDSYPWQVAVVTASSTTSDRWLCGGTLVSADLVLTAAHCVLEDDGRIAPPANIYALNGSTDMNDSDLTGDGRAMSFTRAADVALYPGVNLAGRVPSGDLALVRLQAPPPLGRPLHVVDADQVGWWAADRKLRVTGWGLRTQDAPEPEDLLRWASVYRQADESCAATYGGVFGADTMFCALGRPLLADPTGPVGDTCQGDSGGPITASLTSDTEPTQPANPDAWALVGVTSWGTGCGNPAFPGVYARLGEPALRAFATDPAPTWAPVNVTKPTMPTAATVGDVVTCTPGIWSGQGITLTYEFHRLGPNGSSTVVQAGPSNTYTVAPGDTAGLVCVQLAANAGGTTWAQTGAIPVTPAAVPPAQIPPPQIPVAPPPPPAGVSVPPPVARTTDRASPRSSQVRARCKRRRCTVTVRVTDRAPSSGIRRVTGTVRYTSACRRHGRRTTCTRTYRLGARHSRGSTWTFRLRRLPRGRAQIAIVAVDRAGRVQSRAAKKTFRVR